MMNKEKIQVLVNQIKEAGNQIAKRIEQVEVKRNEQFEIVQGYTSQIVKAIQDEKTDEEIEAITFEKEQALILLRQHDEVLNALRSDPGSKINRLRAELVQERMNYIKSIENEAIKIELEAQKHKAKLGEELAKLAALQKEVQEQRYQIDHTHLDGEDAFRLGLKSSPESVYRTTLATGDSSVLKLMHGLMFTIRDFLK